MLHDFFLSLLKAYPAYFLAAFCFLLTVPWIVSWVDGRSMARTSAWFLIALLTWSFILICLVRAEVGLSSEGWTNAFVNFYLGFPLVALLCAAILVSAMIAGGEDAEAVPRQGQRPNSILWSALLVFFCFSPFLTAIVYSEVSELVLHRKKFKKNSLEMASPLARFVVDACVLTFAEPGRIKALAVERGWEDHSIKSNWLTFTAKTGGNQYDISFMSFPGYAGNPSNDHCSVNLYQNSVGAARAVVLDELRRELDRLPASRKPLLSLAPINTRMHHDGYLRYDSYRLDVPDEHGLLHPVNLVFEVSIRHERVVCLSVVWPRP